jgi:hypothetical protein
MIVLPAAALIIDSPGLKSKPQKQQQHQVPNNHEEGKEGRRENI